MADPKTIVVKIGGNVLGPNDTTFRDIVALRKEGVAPVVVHGGGPAVTRWLNGLGVETRFVDGLRVTDEAVLDVVIAVLSGLVNKTIVAAINAAGGRAVGLSGADGATVQAQVRNPDLGLVGEVSRVQTDLLEGLMHHDFIPVLSPVSLEEGPAGRLLNVNADAVAGAVAHALGADRVVFLTDVAGVLDADGTVLPTLTADTVAELITSDVITGGMVPKVSACLTAVEHGVVAQIADGRAPGALRDALADTVGTRISRQSEGVNA